MSDNRSVNKPARVVYTNYKGDTTLRFVTILYAWFGDTKHHPTPGAMLEVWDHDKHAVRSYRLEDCDFTLRTPHAVRDGNGWVAGGDEVTPALAGPWSTKEAAMHAAKGRTSDAMSLEHSYAPPT